MTREDIEELSLDELRDKLESLYSKKGLIQNFLVIENKMISIAKQFDKGFIDVLSEKDNPSFDRFIKFSKESRNIETAQLERLTLIDEDVLINERTKRLAADDGSLESFVE